MNNRPPLQEAFPAEQDQRTQTWAAKLTGGWSNWFTQVFLALMGWKRSFNYTFTIDFGSVSANAQAASSGMTIEGVRQGDAVDVTPTSDVSGIIFTGVVTAADTVTVYAKNFTTAPINPASQVFRIVVLQN